MRKPRVWLPYEARSEAACRLRTGFSQRREGVHHVSIFLEKILDMRKPRVWFPYKTRSEAASRNDEKEPVIFHSFNTHTQRLRLFSSEMFLKFFIEE
jgi:hypothetical protein